jgi:hypothetical protein
VLALTCHIELFVQAHCDQRIAPHEHLCPLWKDVLFTARDHVHTSKTARVRQRRAPHHGHAARDRPGGS